MTRNRAYERSEDDAAKTEDMLIRAVKKSAELK